MDTEVNAGDRLAVYGLLRQGQSGWSNFALSGFMDFVGPCELSGELYDMGGFPGLYPGTGRVCGDLFVVKDVSVINKLDLFEDYYPHDRASCRYLRVMTDLAKPAGMKAWVYHCCMDREVAGQVVSGDWIAHWNQHYANS